MFLCTQNDATLITTISFIYFLKDFNDYDSNDFERNN